MTTYKELFGKPVKHLSTDPTDAEAAGQIWYNTTSGTFKSIVSSAAWSSASPLITAVATAGTLGIQTAALSIGGRPAGGGSTNVTQHYNGSGFSSGGNLNQTRSYLAGCGTTTAGLAFGGWYSPPAGARNESEEYNGSSWTAGNVMGTARFGLAGAGTQTSGLAFGGTPPISSATEEYGGTSWTAGGAMNTARNYLAGFGASQTAAIAAGGQNPAPTNKAETELYNGTSWSEVNNLNTARGSGLGGSGTSTSGIVFGGISSGVAPGTATGVTESWDGTSWTTSPASLATVRYFIGGAGADSTSAVAMGGRTAPDSLTTTEEFNVSINTVTPGAWATGGTLPYSVNSAAGAGSSKTAALQFGGAPAPNPGIGSTTTNEYDGTNWAAGGSLSTTVRTSFGTGTQTAALCAGGINTPPGNNAFTATEEYNGASWTGGGALNAKRAGAGGFGIQTAAVLTGGEVTASPSLFGGTELYDGSSWTTGNSLSTNRGLNNSGLGIQTAGIVVGGGPPEKLCEEYDGTNWTAISIVNVGHSAGATSGTASLGKVAGGSPVTAASENWNGTIWVTDTSISTARNSMAFSKNAGVEMVMTAGATPPVVAVTEEFTAATSAIAVKTLTTS